MLKAWKIDKKNPCLQIGRIDIIKICLLPKVIHSYNVIPIKTTEIFFEFVCLLQSQLYREKERHRGERSAGSLPQLARSLFCVSCIGTAFQGFWPSSAPFPVHKRVAGREVAGQDINRCPYGILVLLRRRT